MTCRNETRHFKDAENVAGEIFMLRAYHNKTILVVEGTKDEKVFAEFISEHDCQIVIAFGKDNAEKSVKIVRGNCEISGVLWIVDRDFSDFLESEEDDANLLKTDQHDLEMLMIESKAFDKLVREYASSQKVATIIQAGATLKSIIMEAVYPLGVLRLYSIKNDKNFKFEGFECRHISRKYDYNIKDMVRMICNHSNKHDEDIDDICRFVKNFDLGKNDMSSVCCGHDFVQAFCISLRHKIGSHDAQITAGEYMERSLRLAFGAEEFVQTRLYLAIKDWELRTGFKVLRF